MVVVVVVRNCDAVIGSIIEDIDAGRADAEAEADADKAFVDVANSPRFKHRNLMQCVAPTQDAVTSIVTQTPKYI